MDKKIFLERMEKASDIVDDARKDRLIKTHIQHSVNFYEAKYGDVNLVVAMEELAELIEVITDIVNTPCESTINAFTVMSQHKFHLLEEMADVRNSMRYVEIIFDIPETIEEYDMQRAANQYKRVSDKTLYFTVIADCSKLQMKISKAIRSGEKCGTDIVNLVEAVLYDLDLLEKEVLSYLFKDESDKYNINRAMNAKLDRLEGRIKEEESLL